MAYDYPHENNQSENKRLHNACRDERLSDREERDFSEYFHNQGLNQERMTYREIMDAIQDWQHRNDYDE